MKFSTHLLAICAAAIMATAPGLTSAQVSPSTKPPATATPTTTTTISTIPKPPTTVPTPPTTGLPTITTPPRISTSITLPPVITTAPRTFTDSVITVAPTPGLPVTCNSSGDCPANHICMLLTSTAVSGTCQPLKENQLVCPANPTQPCNSHADCRTPEYSYCATDSTTKQNVCTGFGRPGSDTECKNGTTGTGNGKSSNGNVGKTLMYAGIAVGGIALLGIVFALVRWQRRRQRSKMPASMFGDMDYGYPFSSRPNAQEDNYNYDDNYYETPGGYNNNMHPMTGMAGGAKMNDQYYDQGQGQDQYYDDQYYAKEGYNNNNNNGYDQNGQYVGNGQDGFYDTQNMQAAAGYDNYQYPDQ
ncbi:hypothetical protein BGZ92_002510, partial [Podila epicladia]